MNQKQLSFYIRVADHKAGSIVAEAHRDLKNRLLSEFGPHTIYPGLRGMRFNRTGRCSDAPLMLVQVVAKDCPDLETRIHNIAMLILDRFGVEDVFVTLGDADVLSFGNGQDNQPWNERGARNGRLSKKLPESLTPRERQVLALVATGFTNQGLAQVLYIAEATAENHVRNIRRKLGARNRAMAVYIALSNGILQPINDGKLS